MESSERESSEKKYCEQKRVYEMNSYYNVSNVSNSSEENVFWKMI